MHTEQYPATIHYFHKPGKLLETLRQGPHTLHLAYYCAGTGWSPFPADHVAKGTVPASSFYYDPQDEVVLRALDAVRGAGAAVEGGTAEDDGGSDVGASEAGPVYGAVAADFDDRPLLLRRSDAAPESPTRGELSGDEQMLHLQQELRDAREHAAALRTTLDTTQHALHAANTALHALSPATTLPDAHQLPGNVAAVVGHVRHLRRELFWALGLAYKESSGSRVPLQDVYEYCVAARVPWEVGIPVALDMPVSRETRLIIA